MTVTDSTLYTNSPLNSGHIAKVITYDELTKSTRNLGSYKNKSFDMLTTTCEKMFDSGTVINVQNTSGEIDAVKVRPEDKAVLYYPSLELRKKHQYYYAKIIRAPDETVKGPDEIYMRLRNVTVLNLTTIACGTYTDG